MEGKRTRKTVKKGVIVWRDSQDIYLLREIFTLEPHK